LTKLMTDSYDQVVKDALESIKEGLDALPKREWVGLTDDEVDCLYGEHCGDGGPTAICEKFAPAIEAKLKERNHGT